MTKEVACVSFLRTVIVNRGNSCELHEAEKKNSCFASMSRFILALESFLNV